MGSKRKRGANKAASTGDQPTQKRSKTDHSATDTTEPTSLSLDKSPFSETASGENRKREAKIYELLGSADSDERIAAADALVTGLLASTEPALERHLDKRLFRGLASSRNASRLGFSLVLTEILGQLFGSADLSKSKFPGLTFDRVIGILVDNTQSAGNVPGQEERDFYFGRLFGLQCFVASEILFSDASRWTQVLDLLLQMADKKVWMRSHCGWVIVETLPQMGQPKAEETLQKLATIGLGKTAEGVGIWLRACSCYPNMKTPAKPWHDPLSANVLPDVARVLKDHVAQDTGEEKSTNMSKQSNWTAQLHFVWNIILSYFQQRKESSRTREHFKLFWTTVIDDGLFSKNASDGQKFRGFMLFQKFLQGFATENKSLVTDLFPRNFMKCLINQAAKEDRYLHRAALKSLQSIEKVVSISPELLLPMLGELFGKHGAYDLDQRTNTKTVEHLMQYVSPDNVKSVLKLLQGPVTKMDEGAPSEAEKLRQAYADYVSKFAVLAKPGDHAMQNGDKSISVLEVGVEELASCAYSAQKRFKPELSEKTREAFRRRLATTFAKVTKQKQDTEYLCKAVLSVEPTAVAMNDEITSQRDDAMKTMQKLLKTHQKSDAKRAGASLGLALLYAITILQLYDGAPDALSILQDLQACSEKMKSKEGGTSELLVEILLALVSRQSQMMRQISEQVFETCTSQVSSEALGLLAEPLLAEENSSGYQALFENVEGDDEDEIMDDVDDSASGEEDGDSGEDEISELGTDVEFVALNGAESGSEDEDEDEKEEDDDGEKAKADAQELADLDDALAQVLKSHRLDKDDDAQSSDDDSDMTDSEMMALDEKLVEVFKQRTQNASKKKDKKDAKESVIGFKHRVLDFLGIYVKQEASNPLAFGLLLPLLELVRTTTAKPLTNKAIGIITEFSKASKKSRSKDIELSIDVDAQFALMQKIHAEASKDASHAFARAASTASLIVASSLFAADRGNADRINEIYARTFSDCQRGVVKLQGTFFSDWVNWGMGHANTSNTVVATES
ncbi:DNA polymerase phi-domain-containing protein [Xylariomycetidae sp. FL2044]|nr:DNA polymerase phi-domain-containing protein [Xylariomycetidae sp. FL2044]